MKISFFFFAVLIVVLVVSCKDENSGEMSKYGNTLRINEPEMYRTLNPHNMKDAVSAHIVSQLYEGLVKFNPKTSSVVPAIARYWEIIADSVFIFHLRQDAYFHNNPCFKGKTGRRIVADDFKYSFELLCTQSDDNKNYFGTLDKVVGTSKYYDASANGKPDFDIEGIKVIDDSTLQITIEKPMPFFLNMLASPVVVVIPKEGVMAYGDDNFVGSGPFMLPELPKNKGSFYLVKNPNYYNKDKSGKSLPYLDSVKISFIGSTRKELEMFSNNQLDMVLGLPAEYITSFMDSYKADFQSKPPKYILEEAGENPSLFNLRHSHVFGFYCNTMNYIDLSQVYFSDPLIQHEKTETAQE
jgi:oligopeptide transport system substrate-binding protein